MGIKRHILQEQASSIDNEKRRCNAIVSTKQNEIEHLKEQLAIASKGFEDYRVRSEILAIMTGKNKLLKSAAINVFKSFNAWKSYRELKKKKKAVCL